MTKRQTIEEFRLKAAKIHGDKYKYLALDFSFNPVKVIADCPEHGEFSTSAHAMISRGYGCQKCGNLAKAESKRRNLEDTELAARKTHGDTYVYRSIEYRNRRGYLTIDCKKHGEFVQAADKHLAGQGCPICKQQVSTDKRTRTEEEIFAEATAVHNGRYTYKRLSREGVPTLTVVCKEHGEFSQNMQSHLAGQGCRLCYNDSVSARKTMSLDEFIQKAREIHGDRYTYTELPRVRGERMRLSINCKFHGKFEQLANDHLGGHGCPSCSLRVSQPNIEIKALLESLGLTVEAEKRIGPSRKTVDIYLPELNLAIEYNGNYWHSSKFVSSEAHREKQELCASGGWRLVYINSDEWKFRQHAVVAYLKMLTGKVSTVHADSAEIVEVTQQEASEFLDTHSLTDNTACGAYLGLAQNGCLKAIVGFNHGISNIELTCFATEGIVVGGFSKLLSVLLERTGVNSVTAYSDNRTSTGEVYQKAGFTKVKINDPDYKYLEPGWDDRLRDKSKYQKDKLIERFGEETCLGKTEQEIAWEHDIYQVYDCGQTKWLLTKE